MKNQIFAFILIGQFSLTYSQSVFENAISSLDKELGFKNTSESFSIGTKPNDDFVNQLKKCGEKEKLEKLSKLINFGSINFATSAELSTNKWDNKYVIEFIEWQFGSKKEASKFIRILNRINYSRIQNCINEKRLMWWKDKNRIYIFFSQDSSMTNHHNEIKQVIISGLNK